MRRVRCFGSTSMSDEDDDGVEEENEAEVEVWDDETRATLRETLEWVIRGELRMAKSSPAPWWMKRI